MNELKEAILRIEKEMKALDGSVDKNLWMIQGLSKAWNICLDVEDESNNKEETYEEWKLKNATKR